MLIFSVIRAILANFHIILMLIDFFWSRPLRGFSTYNHVYVKANAHINFLIPHQRARNRIVILHIDLAPPLRSSYFLKNSSLEYSAFFYYTTFRMLFNPVPALHRAVSAVVGKNAPPSKREIPFQRWGLVAYSTSICLMLLTLRLLLLSAKTTSRSSSSSRRSSSARTAHFLPASVQP